MRSFGESKGDSASFGDKDSFAGGYSYLAGWSSTPKKRKPTGEICRMDFTTDATFRGWASAFGIERTIVDAGAHIKVNVNDDGAATFQRKFIVLGQALIPNETINLNQGVGYNSRGLEEDIELFNATYPLPFGLHITLDVGLELSAGASFLVSAGAPSAGGECTGTQTLNAMVMVNPYAKASLYGSAFGGWLGIVRGGLEVEVDLIRADLPVVARGGINTTNQPKLTFDLTGRLAMSTMAGHVDACGCFLLFCGCEEITSWPGIDIGTVDLFEQVHAEADLSLF